MTGKASLAVIRLFADYNGVGGDGTVLAAADGHPDLRPLLGVGDRVTTTDYECSCTGTVVRINPGWNDNFKTCDVLPDWSTWREPAE